MPTTPSAALRKPLFAYAAILAALLALDAVWLGLIAQPLHEQGIGHLMAEQPLWTADALFYLVYPLCLMRFALLPHRLDRAMWPTLSAAALFGFFAYATYDLSNLATLRDWPVGLWLIDIAWGRVVSMASAVAGNLALDRIAAS
jgi:uncharacterized membrane protein